MLNISATFQKFAVYYFSYIKILSFIEVWDWWINYMLMWEISPLYLTHHTHLWWFLLLRPWHKDIIDEGCIDEQYIHYQSSQNIVLLCVRTGQSATVLQVFVQLWFYSLLTQFVPQTYTSTLHQIRFMKFKDISSIFFIFFWGCWNCVQLMWIYGVPCIALTSEIKDFNHNF